MPVVRHMRIRNINEGTGWTIWRLLSKHINRGINRFFQAFRPVPDDLRDSLHIAKHCRSAAWKQKSVVPVAGEHLRPGLHVCVPIAGFHELWECLKSVRR